jgi:hypothetical protein
MPPKKGIWERGGEYRTGAQEKDITNQPNIKFLSETQIGVTGVITNNMIQDIMQGMFGFEELPNDLTHHNQRMP